MVVIIVVMMLEEYPIKIKGNGELLITQVVAMRKLQKGSQSPKPEPEVEPESSKELNKQIEELLDKNIELLNELEKIREDTILRHFDKLKKESKKSRELNKVNKDIKIIVITFAQQLI